MLRKMMYFVGGSLIGAVAGVTIGLLFTPASGDDIREGARGRVQNALAEAQAASAIRREELEAELAAMTQSAASTSESR
ncbi:MAG TPA: YtxH domain-containing protein [Aggregatilineales bacterium]|nr:YtxH domain-containing protein [Aggregatilineales bacterium]